MDYQKILIELLLEKSNLQNSTVAENATNAMQSDFIGKICMVRTYCAGVFYGKLVKKFGKEGKLENARRCWFWAGAASLSELATNGTSKPTECKFPISVAELELSEIIEVIPMTEKAINSLNEVKIWSLK